MYHENTAVLNNKFTGFACFNYSKHVLAHSRMYCNKNRAVLWQKYGKKLFLLHLNAHRKIFRKKAEANYEKQCSFFELHCLIHENKLIRNGRPENPKPGH